MTGRTATSVTPQGRDLRKLTLPADPGPILSAPLFRAEKNHVGGPLRYASVQQLWTKYRTKAQVNASIHQLRHAHTTKLVNAGVSLETIRRRLGHVNAQTVLRYADQRNTTTDAEIRSWRRRKTTGRSRG